MTDREKLCREFTELTGGRWHERVWFKSFDDGMSFEQVCSCGYHTAHDISMLKHIEVHNPTYTNPADVLAAIPEEHKDVFFDTIGIDDAHHCYIRIDHIIEPDKLLLAAVEWMKEKRK
jgi:hypothetical protein